MDGHFQRIVAANGVAYYVCTALPAPHGFSTRIGGVSRGAFSALNLGLSSGDDPIAVRENRALWQAALGLERAPHGVQQVHGADLLVLDDEHEPAPGGQADALLTSLPGRAIGVYTADCGPVLLAAPGGREVAAVHAGWRGAVAGVLARAASTLADRASGGSRELVAALGPMIRVCCFEVGEEVVDAFSATPWFSEACVERRPGARPHLDLPGLLRRQLRHVGLAGDRIHDLGLCTVCRPDEFHSWRRDGASSGRLQAAIAPAGGVA